MGEQEVVKFLNYLVTNRNVTDSIQTQARQAIQFLYSHIIGKPLPSLKGIVKGEAPYIYQSRNGNGKQRLSVS
jgi:hypothetical protein